MTLKEKNRWAVIGFCLVVLLSYQYAIKNTFDTRSALKTAEAKANSAADVPYQVSLLKKKSVYLDSLLNKNRIKATSLENNILNHLNTYADSTRIKIIAFNKPHKIQKEDHEVSTYEFTLEGSFNALLGLIYTIEQKTRFGEVSHLQFKKIKNYRTGRYSLQAHVLITGHG